MSTMIKLVIAVILIPLFQSMYRLYAQTELKSTFNVVEQVNLIVSIFTTGRLLRQIANFVISRSVLSSKLFPITGIGLMISASINKSVTNGIIGMVMVQKIIFNLSFGLIPVLRFHR